MPFRASGAKGHFAPLPEPMEQPQLLSRGSPHFFNGAFADAAEHLTSEDIFLA